MKWTFVIQQKLKVAMLLGVIMGAVVLFNIILQKNISNINSSVNSMYNDRLIPANDIFQLLETMHNRQLLMEHFLYKDDGNVVELKETLKQYDQKMWNLVAKYEKTFLVDEESDFLTKLKQSITRYSAVESQVIKLSAESDKSDGLRFYDTTGKIALENTMQQLSGLSTIQSEVGNKLVNDTKGVVAASNFLSDIQIVLAIVIGLLIVSLIASSKLISQSPQPNYKMN